jgi:hypothetical protein
MTTESTPDLHEFRTVKQLVQEFPDLITEPALRWELRRRSATGLDQHVFRLGRTLVVHLPGFTKWMMTNRRARQPRAEVLDRLRSDRNAARLEIKENRSQIETVLSIHCMNK